MQNQDGQTVDTCSLLRNLGFRLLLQKLKEKFIDLALKDIFSFASDQAAVYFQGGGGVIEPFSHGVIFTCQRGVASMNLLSLLQEGSCA